MFICSQHTVVGLAGKIVVYGSNVDVYCCVQVLLQTGLPGDQIVVVQPPAPSEVPTNNHTAILTDHVTYTSCSFIFPIQEKNPHNRKTEIGVNI